MAKLTIICPHCGKIADVVSEERIPALGQIFKNYSCGHMVMEQIVALSVADGHFKTCKTCIVKVDDKNHDEHKDHELVDVPNNRDAHWSRAFEFQKEGVEFLEKANFNALLGDEMGLGKTIQALLALKYHKDKLTPTIIVVKSALKLQWLQEMLVNKWVVENPENDAREYPYVIMDGSQSVIPGLKYYIISMSMLKKFLPSLIGLNAQLLLVDESQHFSNPSSQRTKALLALAATVPHRIAISGKPILNRASEYWPTLNLVKPDHWPSYERFVYNWVETSENGKIRGLKPYKRDQFFERTSDYIIRRLKRDVMKDLPKFSRHYKYIDISDSNLVNSYNKEVKELDKFINSVAYSKMGGGERAMNLLAYLSRMRHITGMAKVVPVIEDTLDFLASTEDDNEKIIIGCHHNDVQDNLRRGLADYNPIVLSSGLDNVQRNDLIQEFKKPERRVCIAKILAQGEGVNLQFCSNMIVMERMWNAGKEEQFEARIDRYGQEKPTVADYMIAKNTVDEDFTNIVEDKRRIVGETLSENYDLETNVEMLMDLADRASRRTL